MAYRIDIGTLRPATKLPDGRLRAEGYLTRAGVFEYANPDGSIRREYRPANEVFHDDSLATFALVPLTDDHPPEMLDAGNARKFAVGSIGENIRRDGDHVAASLVVFDAATIEKMEAGKVELSCGYKCDVAETPGVAPGGERYDAVQTNIRGNHVALVDRARAGGNARVRMDAATMITRTRKDGPMEELQAENEALKQKILELEAKLAELTKAEETTDEGGTEGKPEDDKPAEDKPEEKKDARARLDRAIAQRDAAIARAKAAEASVSARVRARVALERRASEALRSDGKEPDLSAMTDRQIMASVVKRVDGVDLGADKSDVYVQARYDAAIERVGQSATALGTLRRNAAETARADHTDPEAAARAAMAERTRNAWKAKES